MELVQSFAIKPPVQSSLVPEVPAAYGIYGTLSSLRGNALLPLPAQVAYLGEYGKQGKTLAAQHLVSESTIRAASHDIKDVV